MPKERRVNSSSFDDRAMVSPYSRGSKVSDCDNCGSSVSHIGDERAWDEARCPMCMEHPHNAVLLLCSSHEKGCCPFICDTSYRHSNCLDQFRKSAGASGSQSPPVEHLSELLCPLCRGAVTGWKVVRPARRYMDSKTRSCSLETCSFNGNYPDLRRHARVEHPSKRPSEASPTRQSNWVVMERQRDIEDALAYHSDIDYGWGVEEGFLSDESICDFEFESDVADLDDSLMDVMFFGASVSFFNLYSSSFSEESPNSGGSRSSDGFLGTPSSNSGPLSRSPVGNTSPSHPGENLVNASGHQQEADLRNVWSRPTYRTENSRGPSYRRENPSTSSHRENNSNISRRSNHGENAPSSSQTRSSYYRREQHTGPSSRLGPSYYHNRGDAAPSAPRRFRGSSTQPHSRYYSNEVTPRSGQASARHIPGSSRQASSRYYQSSTSTRRVPGLSFRRRNSRYYRSSSRY